MYNSILSATLLAAITHISLTTASPLLPRGHDETITLSNCKNSAGVYSSQMGYYPGSPAFPNEQPVIAIVQTGSTVLWEGNSVTGTFKDGNKFTSTLISPKGPDQSIAGSGVNAQRSDWYCRHHAQAGIYTDPSGNTCNMIYYCNHYSPSAVVPAPTVPSPPTPVVVPSAQGTVKFDFHFPGTYAIMPGHWAASDMLASIDQAVGDPYCDSTKHIQIGDGSCRITYTCHGDVTGQTTRGMASMLKSGVASAPGLISYTTERVKVCSDTNPEVRPGQDPCIYTYENQPRTSIASSLEMNVVYVPNGNEAGSSDQGQLSWEIACVVPGQQNCGLCRGLQTGLKGVGGLVGDDLKGIFEGAGVVTEALCGLAGC